MTFVAPIWLGLGLWACGPEPAGHGHSHGAGGHSHGGGGGHAHADDAGASVAVTRWTDSHELFVELDAPVAGAAFGYHAHVTRLADNHAASSGQLTLRFEQDGFVVESHTDTAVARAGIFAATAPAPRQAGAYQLVVDYAHGDERATWDGGLVVVGQDEPVEHVGEEEGEIGFLKEAQWQVPFGVARAELRPMAPEVVASGVAHSAPEATSVVAAPVEGLVAWADALPVVGRTVDRGELLATLVPAGAAEHWANLQAELTSARVDRELATADLARVEGLAPDELVSARRVDEVRAELARAEARVVAAQRRVSALTSGGAGAVSIRAPAEGLVVAVGARHGEAVAAGAPLVTVSAGGAVLVEARVHARVDGPLTPSSSLAARRGDWSGPRDLLAAGAMVLTERLVYDPEVLSAPLAVHVPASVGLVPGDLVELSLGVGQAVPRLAVPHGAVVEVNGQDLVFVQRTGESFSRRRVELGTRDATHVELVSGVEAGEHVVVEGGFDVHVASLSGALESHRH